MAHDFMQDGPSFAAFTRPAHQQGTGETVENLELTTE
jgi:hypothetical protein